MFLQISGVKLNPGCPCARSFLPPAASPCHQPPGWRGGESSAFARIREFFWETDSLGSYKKTRNGMIGANYSSKLSPWLANGSLSPRRLYNEIRRYEEERLRNESTYWLIFELLWRDYFHYLSRTVGPRIFLPGGPQNLSKRWSQNRDVFNSWSGGRTGDDFVDANMREISATGFMSNRGRQNVASFLVRDMNIDWRLGAEFFESCLIDYDPASNYGNWTYTAGVGTDPRRDRYFNTKVQANRYDPEGEYRAHWLN